MSLIKDICLSLENLPVPVTNLLSDLIPEEFQYSTTSVPSALYDSDDFDIQFVGCSCLPGSQCSTTDCMCIGIKSLGIGHYNDRGDILADILADADRQPPVFECNANCSCNARTCHNRAVQQGIRHRMSVTLTQNTGWGLFGLEPIRKGAFVVEYAGEILHRSEAQKRTLAQGASDKNYIHVLREHVSSGVTTTYVDPTHVGNVGRFINHSCSPNLVMIPVRIDNTVPRLALFAKDDVSAGVELSFHYSGGSCSGGPAGIPTPQKPCKCGASTCSGFLPFDQTIFSDNNLLTF